MTASLVCREVMCQQVTGLFQASVSVLTFEYLPVNYPWLLKKLNPCRNFSLLVEYDTNVHLLLNDLSLQRESKICFEFTEH